MTFPFQVQSTLFSKIILRSAVRGNSLPESDSLCQKVISLLYPIGFKVSESFCRRILIEHKTKMSVENGISLKDELLLEYNYL